MEKERYIGYGKLLDLPSGRVGIELTINNPEEVMKAMNEGYQQKFKILVLPVKAHNVTEWRTHSVKIGESKYKQELIKSH